MSATVEQLEALPEGAVVRSEIASHCTWIKRGDGWTCHELQISKYSGELWDTERGNDGIEILWPQPEPDHSMCARLVRCGDRWNLAHPNGVLGSTIYSVDEALHLGYPVPDTRTVEERVAAALLDIDLPNSTCEEIAEEIAAHLANLGLLAKDGEHDD